MEADCETATTLTGARKELTAYSERSRGVSLGEVAFELRSEDE